METITAETAPSSLTAAPTPAQPLAPAPCLSAATVPRNPETLTVVAASAPPPPVRKLRRNGAIARLPRDCRDMVNRMIANGIPYKRISAALTEFGFTVTERNISNWATGGHLDWLEDRSDLAFHRAIQDRLIDHVRRDDAPSLSEAGLQAAATRLSEVLLHKSLSGADIEANVDQYQQLVRTLCGVNREISLLQKNRDETDKYLWRFREKNKEKEADERGLQNVEEVYSDPKPEPGPPARSPKAKALPVPETVSLDAPPAASETVAETESKQANSPQP